MDFSKLKLIVLDFDGVLTNNKVLLNNKGEEFVSCSRADGIAFDALKVLKVQTIILSTEKNKVVSSRAKKLQVESTTDSGALGFGIFGFFTDNTTIKPFNIDPISTKGLTLKSFNISRDGKQPKNFDFTIVMTFGGTY